MHTKSKEELQNDLDYLNSYIERWEAERKLSQATTEYHQHRTNYIAECVRTAHEQIKEVHKELMSRG